MTTKVLRIGSYNIWHAGRVKEDVGAIGRYLSAHRLDLVGLQEVDVGTTRMNGIDTLAVIAKAGGYPFYAFTKAFDFGGGGYGTAILSRYPILDAQTVPLYSAELEPRAFCHAVIDLGDRTLDFFNTHLSNEEHEIRLMQMAQLAEATSACESFVLTGDFNTACLADFAALQNARTVNPNLFPTYYPTQCAIDHIFLSQDLFCTEVCMPQTELSDHYPILVEIRVP